jgi:NADPH:quinone reductase-like Zn-dependent oxidoreductase
MMQFLPFIFRASPAIPEMDFSGVIEECGEAVPKERRLNHDVPVFGSIPVPLHIRKTCGALAEYVVVEQTAVMVMPPYAQLAEVAGLGIAGATA